jgi:hypothetical protein
MIKTIVVFAVAAVFVAVVYGLGRLFSSGKATQKSGCCDSNRLAVQPDDEKPSGGCGSGKCCR